MRASKQYRRQPFTLVEIMVVVVILGILASIVGYNVLDTPEKAKVVKAKEQINNFKSALAMYKLDTGSYPDTSDGLRALVQDPGVEGWKKGGYLDSNTVPKDPWGNPYTYVSPGGNERDYDIICYGKDGEPGGEDVDADITSWQAD